MEILNVITNCGRQGAKISEIGRKANLSHNVAVERCQKLRDAGLLSKITNGRNHIYKITEKGIRFRLQTEEFLTLVQFTNMRY